MTKIKQEVKVKNGTISIKAVIVLDTRENSCPYVNLNINELLVLSLNFHKGATSSQYISEEVYLSITPVSSTKLEELKKREAKIK